MLVKISYRSIFLAALLGFSAASAQSQTSSGLSTTELNALVSQIQADPAQLSTLISSAISRSPESAPAIARRLIAAFPAQIRIITSSALEAVQNAGGASTEILVNSTAVAAAEAAVALGGDFATQQQNVATVAQGVQDAVQFSDSPPVVAAVNAVLSQTFANNDTPQSQANPTGTETDDFIPPPPTTPDPTSPTSF